MPNAKKQLKTSIGPYTIRQRWMPRDEMIEKHGAWAYADPISMDIVLADEAFESRTMDCFIHEVVEHIDTIRDMELEHWKIQVLATDLAQALKPILKKWW